MNDERGRNAVFSIKHHFAEAIYDGRKRVELRTMIPSEQVNTIWLYESSPVQMVTGCVIPGPIRGPMNCDELYRNFGAMNLLGHQCASDEEERRELQEILRGRYYYAIYINGAHRLPSPRKIQGFPPQSWRYCKVGESYGSE